VAARNQYPQAAPARVAPRSAIRSLFEGGVSGNHRLTAVTGMLLLVLLAIEGFTVLSVRGLFTIHAFVGLALLPPIGLKLASTGYRFALYYLGNERYRATGPPPLIPRMTAPLLICLTVGLFGTGVALLLIGPQGVDPWRQLHSIFFFLWFGFMTLHVLTYAWRSSRLARADLALRPVAPAALAGAMTRRSLVLGSLLLGLAVAIAAVPWDAAWLQWFSTLHHSG
jgi:hypothetical protein